MTWNRREVLGCLGAGSANALLFAFGCRAPARSTARTPEVSGEVRSWLHEAVARLHGSGFTGAHALAVSRRRTTAAMDVLGAGVARARCDGVVLAVRDRDGAFREHVTCDLTRDGVAAAVRALVGDARAAELDFGQPQITTGAIAAKADPRLMIDASLLVRVEQMAKRDAPLSSRIVYAAASIEIDDATIWSVAAGRDQEQRLVRVRRAVTRVAWNGTRPVVSEVSRAWSGGVDEQDLAEIEIVRAKEAALALMTPTAYDDGERALVLEPGVAAAMIDAAVRALLTTTAARRPEVARRLATGASVAPPLLTLVDDPTAPGAYGGFQFDDEGEPAAALTLVDRGHVVGRLAGRAGVAANLATTAGRGRRPGHVGRVEPAPSHLRAAPGATASEALLDEGYVLEGASRAIVDPASDRFVLAVARAKELRAGKETGRVFADLELVGDLGSLLASLVAVSKETATIGIRDEVDGSPRWRSIEAPSLRVKGVLRARRRST